MRVFAPAANGGMLDAPTAFTPGTAESAVSMPEKNAARSGLGMSFGAVTVSCRMCSVANPVGTCCRRKKLRPRSPAPISSTVASATSPTTSAPRVRLPVPATERAPCRSDCCTSRPIP